MTTPQKLAEFTERREQLHRELTDLTTHRDESENTALGDLEAALLGELSEIEKKIQRIRAYLEQCEIGRHEDD